VNLATTLELTVPDRVETIAPCGGPYSNFAAVDRATAPLPFDYTPAHSPTRLLDSHARDTAAAQAN
jgi:hypothetical protein